MPGEPAFADQEHTRFGCLLLSAYRPGCRSAYGVVAT
jgi:hypothetical protein